MTTLFNKDVALETDPSSDSELSYDQLIEKYKDTEGVVKAFQHSQKHIAKLEREREEQRKDLEARLSVEDLVNKLASRTNDASNQAPQGSGERQPDTNSNNPADIAALVEQTIARKQHEFNSQSNIQTATEELRKAWGLDYASKLKAKAQELNLSESFLDDVAAKSPKALLSLVLGNEKKTDTNTSVFAPPRSSVNTAGAPSAPSNQLKEHYNKMRKENPKAYWSPKVQNEMFELVEQGKLVL